MRAGHDRRIDQKEIREFARSAQRRADEQEKDIDDVVHNLTHNSYLMKHATSNVLRELQELNDAYPDAFYNRVANEHLIEYAEQDVSFDFWYDYLYMFLATGLEWTVLEGVKEPAANVDF